MTTLEIEQRVEASAEVTETEVDTLAPKAAETEGVRDLAPSEAASKPQNILDCNQPRSGEPMKQSDALLGRSPTRVEEWLELHTAPREETEAPSMADLHTTNVFVELESPREVTPGEELTMQSPVSAPADCVGSDTESSNASVVQRSKRELAKMKRNQEMKRKKAAQLEKDSAKTSEKLEEQRKMKLELKNKAAKVHTHHPLADASARSQRPLCLCAPTSLLCHPLHFLPPRLHHVKPPPCFAAYAPTPGSSM
ncbi:hypothetical protein CYMTET_51512 [Cymbomonas tetramitiformis]|uniref:Uncharacterized protein n=1 Tax=Cymbomonas tetramitiformis TaxID=36881 RepID=A0AAE0BKW6_9CHLO|nr:hypothetical protein CYMTET_51512 [Cymbomonas tetramitiformis]